MDSQPYGQRQIAGLEQRRFDKSHVSSRLLLCLCGSALAVTFSSDDISVCLKVLLDRGHSFYLAGIPTIICSDLPLRSELRDGHIPFGKSIRSMNFDSLNMQHVFAG
jgi:hypothetical protein